LAPPTLSRLAAATIASAILSNSNFRSARQSPSLTNFPTDAGYPFLCAPSIPQNVYHRTYNRFAVCWAPHPHKNSRLSTCIQKRNPAAKKGQKITKKFIINCSQPVNDKIFDLQAFEKFLHDRIKVEGRTGNLGDTISISQQGDGKIEVIAHQEFSGRYLKYLYVVANGARKSQGTC
jgi:hypothetical protein